MLITTNGTCIGTYQKWVSSLNKTLDLEKIKNTIEGITGFPVFGTDIQKDELEAHESFFLYYENGPIRKAESGANQFLRDFILMFVTKEAAEIDEFALILELPKCGLRFRNTEYEFGKIANTEQEAKLSTFYFHQALIISL